VSAAPSSAPRAAGQALPQLTGIRAVAFLMVFLFHAQFGSYYLWSGVDLFFVLSGYLITGILLAQRGRPGYFRSFYLSRVLRIFPPFYLVLLLVVLAFGAVRPGQLAATAGFAANLYLPLADREALPPSYWALAPYWSLALEEQFYLLWPLLVLRLEPRRLAWVCAALVLAAPLIRVLTLYKFPGGASVETIYMLPFDRLDLLAGGALIALCRELRLLPAETLARLGLWLAGLGLVLLAVLG
jgi:peptidoglycan/LPS O-acetylase OafA/YrhL